MVLMMTIGALFTFKISNVSDYLLGGRKLGSFVTALSAQASDMSGWLLMGLPGAVFAAGMGEVWVAIGLAIGTLLNWLLIAPRLRIYTEKTDSLTLSTYFANRFRDPSGMLRVISALVVLGFFSIYAASCLITAGKLFPVLFNINYRTAVLIGSVVILVYTLLGGYLAVCWTDLVQGLLMVVALVAVPTAAYYGLGSTEPIKNALEARELSLSFFPAGTGYLVGTVSIISAAVWGLGYFGQPHILSRFMSISDIRQLPKATATAMIWVVISLSAACMVGITAIGIYSGGLPKGEEELVFIKMIQVFFNPYVAGVLLSAVLAALMSTIDSQLLVSSSTLTEDFYHRVLRREASAKELVWVSRGFVLLITAVAAGIALGPWEKNIFQVVKLAWGGFGAAFGPVVLMSLYFRKMNWKSALAGMVIGTAVMLVWRFAGLGKIMYEILPGFIAGVVTIIVWNIFDPQKDEVILDEYDEMKAQVSGKKADAKSEKESSVQA